MTDWHYLRGTNAFLSFCKCHLVIRIVKIDYAVTTQFRILIHLHAMALSFYGSTRVLETICQQEPLQHIPRFPIVDGNCCFNPYCKWGNQGLEILSHNNQLFVFFKKLSNMYSGTYPISEFIQIGSPSTSFLAPFTNRAIAGSWCLVTSQHLLPQYMIMNIINHICYPH